METPEELAAQKAAGEEANKSPTPGANQELQDKLNKLETENKKLQEEKQYLEREKGGMYGELKSAKER